MKILFLSISNLPHLCEHSLYADMLRFLKDRGNDIYVICPRERRYHLTSEMGEENGIHILRLKTGNITKINFIEKGITTLLIDHLFKQAVGKYYKDVRFDLVIYTTPPITYIRTVSYVKKRDGAKTYLLLKDIFPQNAVDLGMLSKKSIIYKYFRKMEKRLYFLSGRIGCMSQANVDYLCRENREIPVDRVEVCPNAIEIVDYRMSEEEKIGIRRRYDIPANKTIFVYGGNFGKPQGIAFMIECIRTQKDNNKIYFLLVGSGTEYKRIHKFIELEKQTNVKLIYHLPREEYDKLIASCDVGMVFLDYRFTIPNFPSRLLAYMQAALPVIACTDTNSDVGNVVTENGFGWWCPSNNSDAFCKAVEKALYSNLQGLGLNARKCLELNYSVGAVCKRIIET